MNAVAIQTPSGAMSNSARMNALVPASMAEAMNLAEIMANANLLPDHLRNKPGDCLLVIMQAQRWNMDPVSVAQCTSVVHGKLCYEGKLVAAALYATGALEGRLHYEVAGTGQNASIVVTGSSRGGKGPQTVRGSVKDWRTYGKDKQGNRIDNAWDKMPEDMLVYRGTRQWARLYAPEAMLGVYTPDELDEPEQVRATVLSTSPPDYPAADFEKNLSAWQKAIEAGRRSADDIVAMAETKGRLTDDQKARIRAIKVPTEPQEKSQ
jgi:hypothetical protein